MRHGADWYKREPTAYLGGVQGMSAREHAVFSVVLDLIYQHGGSVNNDPAWFAGWISDMGAAAVRATILALVERGKLTLEDGQLSNNRAKNQAKTKENLSENRAKIGKKGGISSGFSRSTINENKDLSEPIASPREDKRREDIEEREPIGSQKKSIPEKRQRPEVPLPEGWVPNERNITDAEARQFSAQETNDEADRFRNHHTARGTRFRDWDAAWRTWLGNARRFAGGGMAGKAAPGGRGQGRSLASIVAERRLGGSHD